jgi:hypothetical protein
MSHSPKLLHLGLDLAPEIFPDSEHGRVRVQTRQTLDRDSADKGICCCSPQRKGTCPWAAAAESSTSNSQRHRLSRLLSPAHTSPPCPSIPSRTSVAALSASAPDPPCSRGTSQPRFKHPKPHPRRALGPPTHQRLQRRIAAEGSRASRPSCPSRETLRERKTTWIRATRAPERRGPESGLFPSAIPSDSPSTWPPRWPRPGKEDHPPTPARR